MSFKSLLSSMIKVKIGRNPKEEAMDKLLLLYIIKQSNIERRKPGITKLQKMTFLMENILSERNIKALNFKFFRYNYGPFSKEVSEDFSQLVENGLISDGFSNTTSDGDKLLNDFKGVFERNPEIMEFLDKEVEKYAKYDLDSLKEVVYETRMSISKDEPEMKIRDIPQNVDLLEKVREHEAKLIFNLSEAEIEELDIFLSYEATESLKEAEDDAKSNRLLSYDEVFGGG